MEPGSTKSTRSELELYTGVVYSETDRRIPIATNAFLYESTPTCCRIKSVMSGIRKDGNRRSFEHAADGSG